MVRTFSITAAVLLLIAAGCGKKKDKGEATDETAEALSVDDPTCTDGESCMAECERGVVPACALASTVYTLGYKTPIDNGLANRYRQRYLDLRARVCKVKQAALCEDSAPHGKVPDWAGLRDKCRGGDLNSCLRCYAKRFGADCGGIPANSTPDPE